MNYKKAYEYVEQSESNGFVEGMEGITRLLDCLGNPHAELHYIHVAGTNGKGSVISMVASILMKRGLKVGTYTSPCVFYPLEIIKVNGKDISKVSYASIVTRIHELISNRGLNISYSRFEIETAIALEYFRCSDCDVVIMETGMGGTSDTTNIIPSPIISVITSISMDHVTALGGSLESIAYNKAGIIKRGSLLVMMGQDEEVEDILRKRALELGVKVIDTSETSYSNVKLGMSKTSFDYDGICSLCLYNLGRHQIDNAICAIEVVRAFSSIKGCDISEDMLRLGLADSLWRGRFEIISKKPTVVLDGAHNQAGAKVLARAIEDYFTNKPIIYIMGMLKDKEADKILKIVSSLAKYIITVATPNRARTMNAIELSEYARKYHDKVSAADSLEEAYEIAKLLAGKNGVIIAFGSLSHLCGIRDIVREKSNGR